MMAIDPDVHKDLIQELRLASADESMALDKSEFSFDLLDAFRLSLEFDFTLLLIKEEKE